MKSATALARRRVRVFSVTLREVTSSFSVLVIFFDFSALGGSRIPRVGMPRPTAPVASPPKTMVFSKGSGGFWQVEGSPPLVGASGAAKIDIF